MNLGLGELFENLSYGIRHKQLLEIAWFRVFRIKTFLIIGFETFFFQ